MRIAILITLALLAVVTVNHDVTWPKWIVLEFACAGVISYAFSTRYGRLPGLAILWTLGTAIAIFSDMTPIDGHPGPEVLAVDVVLLKATVSFLLTVIAVGGLKPTWHLSIIEGLGFLAVVDAIYVIIQSFVFWLPADQCGGFLGNSSMNGTFIAISMAWYAFFPAEHIPYGFKTRFSQYNKSDFVQAAFDAGGIAICVLAVFLSGSSVPVGVLSVVIASWTIAELKNPLLACLFVCALLIGALTFTPDLLGNSGRFHIWEQVTSWWLANGDLLQGAGNGQFFLIGPAVQQAVMGAQSGFTITSADKHVLGQAMELFATGDAWWYWAHNDWLQTFIELGVVGFLIYLSVWTYGLVRAWKQKLTTEFAVLAGLGAAACFNFVVHSALMAVVIVVTLARIFDKNRAQ